MWEGRVLYPMRGEVAGEVSVEAIGEVVRRLGKNPPGAAAVGVGARVGDRDRLSKDITRSSL